MDQFIVTIEADELKDGLWKVVFRDYKYDLIGIPLRGVERDIAETYKNSLRYAFEYGAKHATQTIARQVGSLWWNAVSNAK